MARTKAPPDSDTLKRERAGTYRSADGRFTIDSAGTGWLVTDAEQSNELGLPLVRGPFATLDAAREAVAGARREPAPESAITGRTRAGRPRADRERATPHAARARGTATTPRRARPVAPPLVVRELRAADGDALRSLWRDCGFRSLADDDRSLGRLVRRNPGLVLVAAEGTRIVGSALGAWDGRRGWIYHVATAESHRRQGIARRLVTQVEAGLLALGCPKVNVLVRDGNDEAVAFWRAAGYDQAPARQFGKELPPD